MSEDEGDPTGGVRGVAWLERDAALAGAVLGDGRRALAGLVAAWPETVADGPGSPDVEQPMHAARERVRV